MENFCVKCGRYHNYESPCPEDIPVCPHGQRARQCPLCELEAEVAAAKQEIVLLKRQLSACAEHLAGRDHRLNRLEPQLTTMRPVFDAAVAFVDGKGFAHSIWDAVRKLDR